MRRTLLRQFLTELDQLDAWLSIFRDAHLLFKEIRNVEDKRLALLVSRQILHLVLEDGDLLEVDQYQLDFDGLVAVPDEFTEDGNNLMQVHFQLFVRPLSC